MGKEERAGIGTADASSFRAADILTGDEKVYV
jgi:hypothetical protein